MICPKCNLNAPKGMKFCPVCGTVFSAVATVSEEDRAKHESENKKRESFQQEEARRKKQEDEEPIYIDPSKTYIHDREEEQSFGFGGLFDGFFGGSIFGSQFSTGRKRSSSSMFGGGLFDIIDDLFGGGYGGGYIDENRAQIAERHEFYHIDEFDEDGFPIIMKDKLIDISPRELEKFRKEEERKEKHNKKHRDDDKQ